ncbi:hypothetical protein L1987_76618 [Smallanthus sonchifolius]|uniref:Uncharacterized protein n=1 Tax=Smallanthus sonchifolius TaxID=185202 RepID=A0ACB8Z8S5_9ASTR|nr:hypothetical protein L1987_76618 [Smallanthus sonchifolius]
MGPSLYILAHGLSGQDRDEVLLKDQADKPLGFFSGILVSKLLGLSLNVHELKSIVIRHFDFRFRNLFFICMVVSQRSAFRNIQRLIGLEVFS